MQQKLTIQMTIFVLLITISFSLIIINEKSLPYITEKVDTKFKNYLEENYQNDFSNFDITKSTYTNSLYEAKVSSKENDNLYFTLKYKNKKITDTYEEDYLEGKTFLNNLSVSLEKKLEKSYPYTFKITSLKPLNSYTPQIKEAILKHNSFANIKIYTLEISLNTNWESTEIINKIINIHNNLKENDITPKSYTFTFTDTVDIANSFTVENLTDKIIKDRNTLESIINAIIEKENTEILEKNNISYKYL